MPEQIFVSYAHEDKWRPAFEKAAAGGVYKGVFQLWFDKNIEPGEHWQAAIEKAISRSRIALLLVGKGFIHSDYIIEKELPVILERERAGGMTIYWVPLDELAPDELDPTKLQERQSVWPPAKPLSGLNGKERDDAVQYIALRLLQKVKLLDATSQELRDSLKPKIVDLIADAKTLIREPFAAGDYSIFYRATRGKEDIAIKAVIPSRKHPWLSRDFIARAEAVSAFVNPPAIRIRSVFPDPYAPCVAMDFIRLPTLAARAEPRMEPRSVAGIIAQLAGLAGEMHKLDSKLVIGPVRPSHVHHDSKENKASISLLPISNETLESCRAHPTWMQDVDALPYLSPESYQGKPIDGRTDQYYLALLALELLQGKPPVSINTFADLHTKEKFFAEPRLYFDKEFRRGNPAFSFVLAKMLEHEPGNRWESMDELVSALQDIARGKVPDAVRQHADSQYNGRLQREVKFFRSFYDILLESPEIRVMFRPQFSAQRQAQKLNRAMRNILNLRPYLSTSSLGDEVKRHRDMNIKAEHFGLFRDAFIAALEKAKIADGYSKDAWRAVLDPALNYLRMAIESKSA
jgi:serine/threonine protein kinase